jgi:predicted phage terminase large subunit-like protein
VSRNRLPPLTRVSEAEVDLLEQEILVRAKARKEGVAKTFDPVLGSTAAEADIRLAEMAADINKYGEYVFGWAPARVHRLWNDVVDDVINRRIPQNKVLFIAPPNSAKSSWNSIVRPCHYLGNHPDHKLVFMTSADPMAKTFHSAVQTALEYSDKHKAVFPELDCRPNLKRGWSTHGLYLRGTPVGSKDPAYKAVGYNATIMGARADGIIIDDPLDQKTALSETVRREAKTYYDQTIVPRLQPDTGWILAVMTRFHEDDLASHFIRLAEEAGDWVIVRTPQIATDANDPLGRAPGELLWPERINAAYVAAEQRRMGTAEFNLVHQGDPTGMGGDVFKDESWFQPLPQDFWSTILPKCKIVIAWDLAFSENKSACFTVGVTVAIDRQYNMYIINVVRKRMTILEAEDVQVKLIQLTKPLVVAIEQSTFHQELTRTMARRILNRVMCNIQLIKPDSDKISRAMLPAARAEAGKVFVAKDAPWYRTFAAECLGFPLTKYKDQVDAFSLAAAMVEKLSEMQVRNRIQQTEHVMSA